MSDFSKVADWYDISEQYGKKMFLKDSKIYQLQQYKSDKTIQILYMLINQKQPK